MQADELGFDDFPEGAVVLIEWPDRAAGFLPADRLLRAAALSWSGRPALAEVSWTATSRSPTAASASSRPTI